MMPAAFLRLLCAFIVLLLPTAQLARAVESPPPVAYEINLEIAAGQRALLEDNLDLYRWRGSDRTSEIALRRLVVLAPAQIRGLLTTEGFFSPRIETRMAVRNGKRQVDLTVDPGPPTRVTDVDLQVTGAFADESPENRERLAKMRTAWTLSSGATFRQADWETAKRNALNALLLERYPRASIVASAAEVDPEKQTARLKITLDSGPAVTFGNLQVEGLERYPASVVRNVNPIEAGEAYSQSRLLELQSRLQNSPYFSSVDVGIDNDATAPAEIPIRVEVAEQPSKKLGFGIGMSTDTGPRGQIDYRDLNLRDRAWQLGGTIKLARVNQSLSGDIQLPPSGKYRDSLTALAERTDIEDQETRKVVLGAKRSLVEGKNETVYSVRHWNERQYVGSDSNTLNQALSLSYSWTRRDVDDLLFPTRGYLVNLQADAASHALLSSQSFVRGYGRVMYFHPVGKRNQFILRGELGAVSAQDTDGIPSDFLFRTGGDKTVRGYAYQSLGVEQDSAVVGGRFTAVASAEYVRWLNDKWGAAFFVDHGGAADTWGDLELATGYGIGARWKSPVGPLNVDLAYGQEERTYRVHFSVGFSF
jgi:translocation and assembly module TamA